MKSVRRSSRRIALAALRHFDNPLGDDFLRRPPVGRRGELAARLLDLAPGGFEHRDQTIDRLRIESRLGE